MNWWLTVGSIIAVVALAAIARLLGLGGGTIAGEEEAERIAAEALPGFAAASAIVSEDKEAALVFGSGGDVALLKQHGTQVAARRLARPLDVRSTDEGVRVESGERMFGAVLLKLPPEERDRLLTML